MHPLSLTNQPRTSATDFTGVAQLLAVGIAGAFGLVFFYTVFGGYFLDPTHIGWLLKVGGDPAQHYLGWSFLRNEPWSLPPGRLHDYGMETARSIVYTDSIPFLALTFKLFRAWLSHPFQYTGIWLVASFCLQGLFGALLVRRLTAQPALIALGGMLFVLSPAMLLRAGGHFALMGHWLILAALWQAIAPGVRHFAWRWCLLLVLAVLTHAYLGLMALALAAADWVRRTLVERQLSWRAALSVAIWWSVMVALVMWLSGYFLGGGVGASGAGYYSMNLLAPLLPTPGLPSEFLSSHPLGTNGQYEGANYLGFGVLGLLLIGSVHLLRLAGLLRPRLWPLLSVVCILALLAPSSKVMLGSWTLIDLPPIPIFNDIFRATGRLFWPMHYLLILLAIALTACYRLRYALPLLVFALVMQLVDVQPLIRSRITERFDTSSYRPVLSDPFWGAAARQYRQVIVVPPTYTVDDFVPLSAYAAAHRLAINMAYYARPPTVKDQAARQARIERFLAGRLNPESLYVLRDSALRARIEPLLDPTDALGRVDGQLVVAPQGHALELDRLTVGLRAPGASAPLISSGSVLHFNVPNSALISGWSRPERWGVWSDEADALLALRVDPAFRQTLRLIFNAHAFSPMPFAMQRVAVNVNGHRLAEWRFTGGVPNAPLTLEITPAVVRDDGLIYIALQIGHPLSPVQAGTGSDPRRLGIGLESLRVQM